VSGKLRQVAPRREARSRLDWSVWPRQNDFGWRPRGVRPRPAHEGAGGPGSKLGVGARALLVNGHPWLYVHTDLAAGRRGTHTEPEVPLR
jgi:hypothetical protein